MGRNLAYVSAYGEERGPQRPAFLTHGSCLRKAEVALSLLSLAVPTLWKVLKGSLDTDPGMFGLFPHGPGGCRNLMGGHGANRYPNESWIFARLPIH